MGKTNIADPLALQEKSLDLLYRNRKIEEELKILRQTNVALNKKAIKDEQTKVAQKIISAEKQKELSKS